MNRTIQPHQKRVIDEKNELYEKIHKLELFVDGPIFKDLPENREKHLLLHQLSAMDAYSLILGERISLFGIEGVTA